MPEEGTGEDADLLVMGGMISLILSAILGFFVNYFLYSFSDKMKKALNDTNQELLDLSLADLRSYFRFIGILSVVSIVFLFLAYFWLRF